MHLLITILYVHSRRTRRAHNVGLRRSIALDLRPYAYFAPTL